MQKLFLVAFWVLTLTAPGLAQDLKPITHEEMWMMKRVGSPSLSPDGKWVIFSVLDPSYNEKNRSMTCGLQRQTD
ncbi:MAG: hypothetical protein IPK46_20835 [Saprospiraceae bacterium]|nr:hypothetical protein [Saprospiraceae bacterium]